MKKTILLFLLCFSVMPAIDYAASDNCPPRPNSLDPDVMKSVAASAKNHGFLWRISKNDQTSYLYGTIHLSKFDTMFPGPTVKEALNASNSLALELDMLDPAIQKSMQQKMLSMQGHSLPEKQEKAIKQIAQQECIPYDAISAMTPELQVTTLQLSQARRDALFSKFAIDVMLSGYGHAAGKNVISLETPEMQLDMLQMESATETSAFVQKALDQMSSGEARKLTLRMFDDWASSNYDDMNHYQTWCKCMETKLDKKIMYRLLDQRNQALADKIDAIHLSGKPVFAAVGSLHMVGENGLPALMRKLGYQVNLVKFSEKQ
jgi:uncharacterized protein